MTLALLSRLRSVGLAPRLVALAVVVACVAGGSVAAWVVSNARAALRDEILETRLAMAEIVATDVGNYVSDMTNDAIDLAERPDARLAFVFNDFAYLDDQLAHWYSNRKRKVDTLAVFSPEGRMVATSRADHKLLASITPANFDEIRRVASTGLAGRGTPLRAQLTGNPIVPIYVPVRSEDGQVVGVLAETLSLESLSDTLRALHLTPHTRVSMTDNASGLVMVSDDRSRLLMNYFTNRNAAAQHMRAGEQGAMENTRSDGEATLAAYTPVPGLPWAVMLQEPSTEAFAPIEEMTSKALIWVSVAMLLAGLVAAGLALSMVRPLRKLRATAERMASGELSRRTGVRRGDEIGDLGHAFDRMAEQLQDSVEKLTRQALSDGLTTLPNRVLLRQRLEQAIGCEDRLALLVIDLDRFKEVNDTLGHSTGDALLQQLASRLQLSLRKTDTMARLGGDEFAIVLPGADQADAVAIAQELRALVGKPFELDGRVVTVGASIGIATLPEHGPDADTLLRCADVAMYVAKRAGNGASVYSPDQDQHTLDRLALIGELSDAIDRNELTLAFQPLMSCEGGAISGVEALVRWPHPRHGLLPSDQFVPLAEQTGLIRPMSRWVLETALRQQREWRRRGLDVPVSVNLSMRDLHDPSLPETVVCLLEQLDARPGNLRVEITESSLMSDPARALQTLSRLREIGVDMSIDDFGTGYSSLAYLKQLPVDELKIDRSFVRAVAVDDSDLAIVRSTIDLAHNLGLQVVAEGVEDSETLELLRRFGCDKAQGYLFSRPMAAAEVTRWLLEHTQGSDGFARAA